MPRGGSFPNFSKSDGVTDYSAREFQTMSDAAKASAEAGVGSGMTKRGVTPSVVPQPKVAAPRTVKVVAVIGQPDPADLESYSGKPNPRSHRLIVREVTYAFEGADYVPPDSMPEPPPPIEPTPGTLRWKGEPFFALPGYNHSVAEFAATWFSDILRDDAGEPELVDNKTVMRPPDDTTTLHYLHLRPQGPPVLFPMESGGGFDFAVVRSVEPADPEISVHQSYTVWAQGIQRISGWPPDSMPDPMPEHGGWEWVGDTQEVATYPGIPAVYYKPFVWDVPGILFPDIPIARVFRVGGETYIEQPMRWATIEADDGVRVSACLPVTRRTEEMP